MTEDQHKELSENLEKSGFTNIQILNNNITCQFLLNDTDIELSCILSECFPYELPTVYINSESYKHFSPLPHVNHDLSICTFDRTICIPNFLFPIQVIEASFSQAKKTICEGVLGNNQNEFFSEIDAYWQIECTQYSDCIVIANDTIKTVKLFLGSRQAYIADTKHHLDRYLSNVGIKKRYQKHYFDCLYLPLSIQLSPPFPTTNLELLKLFQTDPSIYHAYRVFIQKRISKGAFILTSTPNQGTKCLQLWWQPPASISVPGFRKGHVPANIAYLYDTQQKPVVKYAVANMRQERLFFRGGEGMCSQITRCSLIGCGSIGSYLAEALAEYGVEHFALNDKEALSPDNIARHLCGYNYVGKRKAAAVSSALKKHNPNISTEVFDENGITFLKKHCAVMNNCDCIFIATAYTPLEYIAVEHFNSQMITKPVIILWVEPYLAAGHALIIQKPQDVFAELFDADYVFQHKVIKNHSDFSKKESGCQSTFIPYSAFHLKRFIYTFLDFLVRDVVGKHKVGNYLFTWCGDLSQIKSLGGILEDEWFATENFSTHITRID